MPKGTRRSAACKSMWVACTPPCVATRSVEYVQWGRLCSSSWNRSHGVEHGSADHCQGEPLGPPVMEVQVKVLSQKKKQFVWRRVSLWSKLGNTKPKKKLALADMGAMVCTVGLNMFGDLGSRDQCIHWRYQQWIYQQMAK